MTAVRHIHGDAVFVGFCNGKIVVDASARMRDCSNTRLARRLDAIVKREKRVGRHNAAYGIIAAVLDCLFRRPDTVGLTRAYSDGRYVF